MTLIIGGLCHERAVAAAYGAALPCARPLARPVDWWTHRRAFPFRGVYGCPPGGLFRTADAATAAASMPSLGDVVEWGAGGQLPPARGATRTNTLEHVQQFGGFAAF